MRAEPHVVRGWPALAAAGCALGAVGVAVRAAGGADVPHPVPPGLVLLALAAVAVVAVRARWVPVAAAAVAVLVLLNAVAGEGVVVLLGGGRSGAVAATGGWLLLGGAGAAAVAGVPAARAAARGRPGPGRTVPGGVDVHLRVGAQEARAPWWQVGVLLVLAPVCAEYLAAYDDTTGAPVRLLFGLLVFVPLYGAPALLLREVARRARLGWAGLLLLATAFGLVQAGLVDQSLYSLDYRHIASWDASVRGTFIAPLGLSAANAVNFVGGHLVWSTSAPIALAEELHPATRHRPWLSARVLVLVAVLWLAACALVLADSLRTETSHASTAQVLGTAAVVLALVVVALSRRPGHSTRAGARGAPRPWTVLVVCLAGFAVEESVPPTWPGAATAGGVLVLGAAGLHRLSSAPGWGPRHVVAVAAGAVLARALLAFTYFPLVGDVGALPKYGHNAVLLVVVAGVSVLAARASGADRRAGPAG